MVDITKMCRLCGVSAELGVCLLDPSNQRVAYETTHLFHVEVNSSNGFPTRLCPICLKKVRDLMLLKATCLISHRYFCHLLQVPRSYGVADSTNQITNTSAYVISQTKNIEQTKEVASSEISEKYDEAPISDLLVCDEDNVLCLGISVKNKSFSEGSNQRNVQNINMSEKTLHQLKNQDLRVTLTEHDVKKYMSRLENPHNQTQVTEPNLMQLVSYLRTQRSKSSKLEPFSQVFLPENNPEFCTEHFDIDISERCESSSLQILEIKSEVTEEEMEVTVEEMDWDSSFPLETTEYNNGETTHINPGIGSVTTLVSEPSSLQTTAGVARRLQRERKKKILQCPICDRIFGTEFYFKLHLARVHHLSAQVIQNYVPKVHKCRYCDITFNIESDFLEHLNTHTLPVPFHCDKSLCSTIHNLNHTETQVNCSYCNKQLRNECILKVHIETHHNGKRFYNNYKFDNYVMNCKNDRTCSKSLHENKSNQDNDNLQINKYNEVLKKNETYFCDQCNMSFPDKTSLTYHMKRKNINGYDCKTKKIHVQPCHDTLTSSQWKKTEHNFEVHTFYKILTNDPYVCYHCSKMFINKYFLTCHIKRKHFKSVHCNKCGMNFKTKKSLKTHTESLHTDMSYKHVNKNDDDSQMSTLIAVDKKYAYFVCGHCSKTFTSKTILTAHIKRTHIGSNKMKVKIKKTVRNYVNEKYAYFVCDHCSKTFTSKTRLTAHIKTTHIGSNKMTKKTLRNHGNEKYAYFACDHCSTTFMNKTKLTVHIKRTHIGSNKMTKKTLRNHGNEKYAYFVCCHCSKTYTSKTRLTVHIKTTHIGSNKYEMMFKTKKTRRNHVNEKYAYFVCGHCSKTFMNKTRLSSHIERTHRGNKIKIKKTIRNHIESVHSENTSDRKEKDDNNLQMHTFKSVENSEYLCTHCNKKFINKPLTIPLLKEITSKMC